MTYLEDLDDRCVILKFSEPSTLLMRFLDGGEMRLRNWPFASLISAVCRGNEEGPWVIDCIASQVLEICGGTSI